MKQPVDVLAAFNTDSDIPRPIRFKMLINGVKKPVDVSEILETKSLGAGGMSRYEYICRSPGYAGPIEYTLKYYYKKSSWEIEIPEN